MVVGRRHRSVHSQPATKVRATSFKQTYDDNQKNNFQLSHKYNLSSVYKIFGLYVENFNVLKIAEKRGSETEAFMRIIISRHYGIYKIWICVGLQNRRIGTVISPRSALRVSDIWRHLVAVLFLNQDKACADATILGSRDVHTYGYLNFILVFQKVYR